METPVLFSRWAHAGMLGPATEECLVRDGMMACNASSNGGLNNTGVWPATNRAIYLPFEIQVPIVIKQLGWANASTLTGTADSGIYSVDGRLLVSTGATARSGGGLAQIVDVTDTLLNPGNYALALLGSSTAGTYFRSTQTVQLLRAAGVTHEDVGASALPSTTTFPSVGGTYVPWVAAFFNSVV